MCYIFPNFMSDHSKHLLEASVWTHGDSCASREVISKTLQKALFKTQVDAVKVVKEPARNGTVREFQGSVSANSTTTTLWNTMEDGPRRDKAVFVPSFDLVLFLKLLESADGAQNRQVARGSSRSAAQCAEGSSEHQIVHHVSPQLHYTVKRQELVWSHL